MGKKHKPRKGLKYSLAFVLLLTLVGSGWAWWHMTSWTPDDGELPAQGALIGASDGAVDFKALKATGADLVYLEASDGQDVRDTAFARNLADAMSAELQVGAVHSFDPCLAAELQSANFVTVVPRDGQLLPPAIALERTADNCEERVSAALVESELMTFLNQIETHVGKPAILKVSREFEDEYGLSARIGRKLWLSRNRFRPDYGKRPWAIWTANTYLRNVASEEPVRWLVLQP